MTSPTTLSGDDRHKLRELLKAAPCMQSSSVVNEAVRDFYEAARCALPILLAEPVPSDGAESEWKPMLSAPTGIPVEIRTPAEWGWWMATAVVSRYEDEGEVSSYMRLVHYNGDTLLRTFYGDPRTEWRAVTFVPELQPKDAGAEWLITSKVREDVADWLAAAALGNVRVRLTPWPLSVLSGLLEDHTDALARIERLRGEIDDARKRHAHTEVQACNMAETLGDRINRVNARFVDIELENETLREKIKKLEGSNAR